MKQKNKLFLAALLIIIASVTVVAVFFSTKKSGEVKGVDDLSAQITRLSSSSLTVTWSATSGATGYNVYLASEPADLGVSDNRKLLVTVPASTHGYQLTNLAANVDVFIRIEAIGTSKYSDIYAKTPGGQGVTLDKLITSGLASTSLKSVSLYAPNILLLVIEDKRVQSFSPNDDWLDKGVNQLVNYTGTTWQSGTWSITRNSGTAVTVNSIERDSIPVGNLYDTLIDNGNTHGGAQNSHLMDVDHYIYLKLDQSIGNKDILNITGPNGLSVVVPYSDKYLETPVIQVNQVGYNPRATKRYAYISGWLGSGSGLNLSNFPATASVLAEGSNPIAGRSTVTSGLAITVRSENDLASGTTVKEVDLSSVPASDTTFYRVYVPGVGVSYRTMVSELGTLKAYYVTTRGMFLNRWGRDLDCDYTDWCDRPADHPTVYTGEKDTQGFFPQDTPLTGSRSLVGGHHDAGDFDLRIYHYTVARQLLRAYELNSSAFTDNQLNIPESGNGIPDFLDEALWSIAAWEQLQEADGGVRPGAESWRHPFGNYFADADPSPYWTYARDPIHSLRVAGLFAQASRLVSPFNSTKANQLRTEAINAYNYAIASGMTTTIAGPMEYAASELYRLTGNSEYKTMFENTWNDNEAFTTGMPLIRHLENWVSAYGLATQPIIGDHVLGYLGSTSGDATVAAFKALANTQFTNSATTQINAINNTYAHRNGLPSGWSTAWGKSVGQSEYLMAIYSKMQLGTATPAQEQDYINAISLAADYILGTNPMGISWVTGLGSYSPQNPLHNDSIAFQMLYNLPPMPGIPVYGPAPSVPAANYYDYGENVFYPSYTTRPVARRYADLRSFVSTNEFTIWETQSNVTSVFATLLKDGLTVPTSWKPGQSNHKGALPLAVNVQAIAGPAIACGNAILESGEQCDDGGMSNGDGCTSACAIAYQCNDGIDNDSDGLTDYPQDSNCSSATDNTESASPAGCTESWSCGSWSTCSGGSQSRTCTDANSCGTTDDRPATTQSCTTTPTTPGGGGGGTPGDGEEPPVVPPGEDAPLDGTPHNFAIGGRLVKTPNDSAVYYLTNNTRYLFVNQVTFFSWRSGAWKDNPVEVITQSEFDNLSIGPNVIVRPGAKLIRFNNSSIIYAVKPGGKLCQAEANYGDNWRDHLIIIQNGFETNYTKEANCKITTGSVLPDGTLIRYQGSANTWYIQDGTKRLISTSAMTKYGFRNDSVITNVPTSMSYTEGDAIN